jgi:hypothetical protein
MSPCRTTANCNDRPGPDVSVAHNAPTIEQLAADSEAGEKRIAELKKTERRARKGLLFENLDQALRIATAVDVHGLSVAEADTLRCPVSPACHPASQSRLRAPLGELRSGRGTGLIC